MKTVKLLSWHEDITTKAASLKRRGLKIDAAPLIRNSGVVGELAHLDPAALVLDLDKLPSRSRSSKSAHHIPILFAGGLPEKTERIRAENPDASYAAWSEAPSALTALLLHPPATLAIAPPRDFSTTPLPKRLGINSSMEVALIAAPDGFEELLGDLPEKTTLLSRLRPTASLALCFIRSLADLVSTLDLLKLRLPRQASVWIVHPKRTGKHHVDFNQNHVRDESLAAGLVDYKVCSIDSDWSALKFAWRSANLRGRTTLHDVKRLHRPVENRLQHYTSGSTSGYGTEKSADLRQRE
ncbi:DUF3052 family protein [Tunturiibacter gelidoferens]|uniref:Uncharacterized protein n=1 Tax=Tunturiibacter gelidiferens TaxID=3069689 RepID=A0ACC5P0B4_9BACT|nr:DUF3052 family protein [Edaphobacter lichenicola]MBB5340291.1 hypothetical protein [Edaphobacter lichenicola]